MCHIQICAENYRRTAKCLCVTFKSEIGAIFQLPSAPAQPGSALVNHPVRASIAPLQFDMSLLHYCSFGFKSKQCPDGYNCTVSLYNRTLYRCTWYNRTLYTCTWYNQIFHVPGTIAPSMYLVQSHSLYMYLVQSNFPCTWYNRTLCVQ